MRLITLTALASTKVGKEISYTEIAQEIQVPEDEVESWVIQSRSFHHSQSLCHLTQIHVSSTAIRAKLILGKLSQPTRTFVVIKSTTREFTADDWSTLDKRLTAWKGAVLDVLQVVTAAKKKAIPGGGTHQNNAAVA